METIRLENILKTAEERFITDYPVHKIGLNNSYWVSAINGGTDIYIEVECRYHSNGSVITEVLNSVVNTEGSFDFDEQSQEIKKMYESFIQGINLYKKGVADTLKRTIGIRNPEFNNDDISVFRVKYSNLSEIYTKVDEIAKDNGYEIHYFEGHYFYQCGRNTLVMYRISEDLATSYCKHLYIQKLFERKTIDQVKILLGL